MPKYVTGKMTSKGQLTIPAELRNQWGLNEGDRLMIEIDDETGAFIGLRPQKKKSLRDVVGILKTDIKHDEQKIEDAIAKEITDNYFKEY
ncbi:AbrB/MazE/SpoVT family DNA-binding domain-containing protein [Paenibacillus arenilitoris]|uniref:AbrB/MazE/SpoVT family DNA-binding domain-containing protein n=1 Tax=Paenibacillus arenilitoris TaxID=2772299 RepID=A0A927CKE4_9BACL|nr:AbrB/MazE/SpoVT family DNA-binding domain-containing protein [Paenibacillus arenilitoris]MBD2869169.1 AbrB/MazE/SpoVT family DNA-binding domain-containing protein [Paenibacillus arenilitoris]